MLDALTPCVLRAFNHGNGDSKKLAPPNYIDKLSEDSFMINKCYGYGETMASNSAMITGLNSETLKSDMLPNPDSFHQHSTLAYYFKKHGFNTVFYRNFPLDGLRRRGPYRRFNALASSAFDHICLEDDSSKLFRDSKIIKRRDDFFYTKNKHSTFIFIHDMAFHDDSKVLKSATLKSILTAVKEKSKRVRKNLEYLNYDKRKDVLIFSSDHGMTLSPYDDMFYDKKISADKMDAYWPKLTADFKLRTCFFIRGPGIKSGNATGNFEIRDMFATVLDFLHIKHAPTGAISAKHQTRTSALVSVAGAPFEHVALNGLRKWFHPYVIYVKDSKKWIYRKLGEAKCYRINLNLDPDEDNPIEVSFSEFPVELKKHIKRYFSAGWFLYRTLYALHPKRFIVYFVEESYLKFKKLHDYMAKKYL
jgi:hypothetical protein